MNVTNWKKNNKKATLICEDIRKGIDHIQDNSVQMICTSPPYYQLRDYGEEKQIGQEFYIEDYIKEVVNVFSLLKDKLKDDGSLWINIGNMYSRSTKGGTVVKSTETKYSKKDLIGLAWMVAFALQRDGWILRNDVIWQKKACQVTPTRDRCTVCHEYLFLFSKNESYYFDMDSILEPLENKPHAPKNKTTGRLGNNITSAALADPNRIWGNTKGRFKRTVWTANPRPYKNHKATYPPDLIKPCILSSSRPGDIVLDPFTGTSTTGVVAMGNGRDFIGVDISNDYINTSIERFDTIFKD